MSIELVVLSNHLILCHPLLLLPSVFPSTRVVSSEEHTIPQLAELMNTELRILRVECSICGFSARGSLSQCPLDSEGQL